MTPRDASASLLGVQIELDFALPALPMKKNQVPNRAYFVRLNGDDLRDSEVLISSTFCNEGRCYLLNAVPGDYAVVAAAYSGFRTTVTSTQSVGSGVTVPATTITTQEPQRVVFMPEKAVLLSRISVGGGSLGYLGKYRIKKERHDAPLDEVQEYYREIDVKGGNSPDLIYGGSMLAGERADRPTDSFLYGARNDFRGSPWLPLLE